LIRDPALRFWLEFVESEGGLCEHDAETADVVLPPALQRVLRLPEALAVTSDPDVARDAEAVLLSTGHPALESATALVIERGDVGRGYLPWPRSNAPARNALLAHARACIGIDHGRIDAPDDPFPIYHPLLRVGALVTYTLDESFGECEEVWVDGCAALPVADDIVRAVAAQPLLADADLAARAVRPEVGAATLSAHHALEERSIARASVFERQAQGGLAAELARAAAYYDGMLASIAQRRSRAPAERAAILAAQAEATERERQRRTSEIKAKFRASREIVPHRLQAVFVPALSFGVSVRRGERRYPLALTWLLPAACFAPLRCPRCRDRSTLVAGRSELACRSCAAPPR